MKKNQNIQNSKKLRNKIFKAFDISQNIELLSHTTTKKQTLYFHN